MFVRILIRWLITSIAVAAAVLALNWIQTAWNIQPPLVTLTGQNAWIAVIVLAAVLGFANAIIRPILAFLSCGCIVATLGLFIFVVNALTLYSAGVIASWFGTGFTFSFWGAFWGAIIISGVSFLLNVFLSDDEDAFTDVTVTKQ